MTQATKTLSAVLVILVAITALVKWTDTSSASEAFRSTVLKVDTSRVNRVVIERPAENRTVTLAKQKGGWTVSGNKGEKDYPAGSGLVDRAINQLGELNVKAVATRSPDKFTRYKVDSTGTTVRLFAGDQLLGGIILGAPQMAGRREFNNYVRPLEEDVVYSVEGFLSPTFNRDVEGWREKTVWDVQRDQITQVDFLFPADSSYSIQKAGENDWISDGDTLQTGTVNSLLGQLSSIQAGGFIDSLSTDDFGEELYAVSVRLNNDVQKRIRLKPFSQDSASFQAVAGDFPYVFTVSKSTWENAVLKPRKELLKE